MMTLTQLAARIRSARTEIVLTVADDAQGFAEALGELDAVARELDAQQVTIDNITADVARLAIGGRS